MTNNEVIAVCRAFRAHNNAISDEMHRFVRDNYSQYPTEGRREGNWYKVYLHSNDSKYGAYMINPERQLWSHTNFDEFYGGAIVD